MDKKKNEYINRGKIELLNVREDLKALVKIAYFNQSKKIWEEKEQFIKKGDDLYFITNNSTLKDANLIVSEINKNNLGEVIFLNGEKISLLDESVDDDYFKLKQIEKTITLHLDKQLELSKHNIKVLSLFFIDKVSNYRYYDENGVEHLGKYGSYFESCFLKLAKNPKYKELFKSKNINDFVSKVHDGYFSIDKSSKRILDTKGTKSKDTETYQKIMRDKEKLLSLDEPLSFIFSHSALKEGWDNPNVFQICVLNKTSSEFKKRQEIGRGLRLCVNQDGERIYNKEINELSVITNCSYNDFVSKLQKEMDEEGITFDKLTTNQILKNTNLQINTANQIIDFLCANYFIDENNIINKDKFNYNNIINLFEKNKDKLTFNNSDINEVLELLKNNNLETKIKNGNKQRLNYSNLDVINSDEFQKLWNKISRKTTYKITEFNTPKFIDKTVQSIAEQFKMIDSKKWVISKVQIEMNEISGIGSSLISTNTMQYDNELVNFNFNNFIEDIHYQTKLTRKTIIAILTELKNKYDLIKLLLKNDNKVTQTIINVTKAIKKEELASNIEYLSSDEYFSKGIIESNKYIYLDNDKELIYTVKNKDKYPSEYIECDSKIEVNFANDADISENCKKFIKLPNSYKIHTPCGSYNPDWGIYHTEQEVIIIENKGSENKEQLRSSEELKINCAKKHFCSIGVKYRVKNKYDL